MPCCQAAQVLKRTAAWLPEHWLPGCCSWSLTRPGHAAGSRGVGPVAGPRLVLAVFVLGTYILDGDFAEEVSFQSGFQSEDSKTGPEDQTIPSAPPLIRPSPEDQTVIIHAAQRLLNEACSPLSPLGLTFIFSITFCLFVRTSRLSSIPLPSHSPLPPLSCLHLGTHISPLCSTLPRAGPHQRDAAGGREAAVPGASQKPGNPTRGSGRASEHDAATSDRQQGSGSDHLGPRGRAGQLRELDFTTPLSGSAGT